MKTTADKIFADWHSLAQQVSQWQQQGEQVVFTNGCFDLLHVGHTDYLEKARGLGGKLVVGVNTDDSIRKLKGETRPVVPASSRARVMAALAFVDAVVLFDEDTPQQLIEAIKPNILVKGDDYKPENIVGAAFVLANGGKVLTLPLVEGFSTSNIINKILKQGYVS